MTYKVREARRGETRELIPLLLLAEPSERALRWSLKNLSDAAYVLEDEEGRAAGAATVRWGREPCEIVELAVAPELQGRGLGKTFVAWVAEEARRRGKREIVVGTRSTSASNIVFYQKCGFRVSDVRRDYFWYYDEPVYENGVRVRDMIVLALDLSAEPE